MSTISDPREQTRKARETFAATFPSPEAKSEHYAALARRRNAAYPVRLALTAEEAAALSTAFTLLARVAERTRQEAEQAADHGE